MTARVAVRGAARLTPASARNNTWAGGDDKSPYNYAVSLPGTTVTLDGKAVVENGQLKL